MSAIEVAAFVISIVMLVFLFYAMLYPVKL